MALFRENPWLALDGFEWPGSPLVRRQSRSPVGQIQKQARHDLRLAGVPEDIRALLLQAAFIVPLQ
jgi:hypothetical protein